MWAQINSLLGTLTWLASKISAMFKKCRVCLYLVGETHNQSIFPTLTYMMYNWNHVSSDAWKMITSVINIILAIEKCMGIWQENLPCCSTKQWNVESFCWKIVLNTNYITVSCCRGSKIDGKRTIREHISWYPQIVFTRVFFK